MLEISIPGFGPLQLEHLVLDVNGTLSFNGEIQRSVKEKLVELAAFLKIHVLTADTFGTAKNALADVSCTLHVLASGEMDVQKEAYVNGLGAEKVAAYGNGRNDRLMLKAARLGIAIVGREGCAADAVAASDVCVFDILDGLDLLVHPKRLEATLKL